MSAHQHRRNYSLVPTAHIETTNKIRPTHRSLRKIQSNNNYSWLIATGKREYYENNTSAAISIFEEYLNYNPSNQECLYLCSLAYIQNGNHNEAICKLKNYLNVTMKRTNSNNNGLNRKLIITTQSQEINSAHIYLLLSITYNKINHTQKALEYVNLAINQENKLEPAYCFRAKLYLKMGENEKAFYDYKQVLKFNGECLAAWMGLGDYYTLINNYKQALTHYTKALSLILQVINESVKKEVKVNDEEERTKEKIGADGMRVKEESLYELLRNNKNKTNEKSLQYSKRYRFNTEAIGDEAKNTFFKSKEKLNQFKITNQPVTTPFSTHLSKDKNEMTRLGNKTSAQYPYQSEGIINSTNLFESERLGVEIKLKISICNYFLGDYEKSMKVLKTLGMENTQNSSEIFYYLAVSQLKLHEEYKFRNINQNRNKMKKTKCIPILRNSQKSEESVEQEYDEISLLQECILNLESSIKSASNKKIMIKSCKTLVKLYIENHQFYETESVIKLAEAYGLDIKQYKQLSEACMLVIKQKYAQAIPIFNRLYQEITGTNTSRPPLKRQIREESSDNEFEKDLAMSQSCLGEESKEKINQCISLRSSEKKNEFSPSDIGFKISEFPQTQSSKFKSSQQPKLSKHRPSHSITPSQLLKKEKEELEFEPALKNETKTSQTANIRPMYASNPTATINHTNKSTELDWMKPIILLFRAYAEFFSDNFIECLTLYENYENFIKDYLGKEPETSIYLSYNKVLCEGILMLDNEMIEESLDKFLYSLDGYHKILNAIPVEPILLRIVAMLRLAISDYPYLNEELNSKEKIYASIIEILEHYMPVINHNPLVHYYFGLVLYELGKYKEASDCLEKCLKIADECTWKYLFVKGVIEIKNCAFKEAAREFSAGLLVEERAEIFLGRCICYIQLFEEFEGEKQVYMEKSFEDLQKFIELENDKDKISKWVTKILFFNKAYEEVTKSIKKISHEGIESDHDLSKIDKCLNIYNGVFEDGGVLGQVLINAFESNFEVNVLQINSESHDIILSDFVDTKYNKWLNILNFYTGERYMELIKYLQMTIFEEKNEEEAMELRYNLAVIYYLIGENSKADNVLAGLPKYLEDMTPRVEKLTGRDLIEDECINDLEVELKGVKRLSSFLPYRKATLEKKGGLLTEKKNIFMKISIPFPPFFKPNIDLTFDSNFLNSETAQSCIPKKIEAPWIKKVTGNIQFTDNIVDSQNTSILDQDDVLASKSESESESLTELQHF